MLTVEAGRLGGLTAARARRARPRHQPIEFWRWRRTQLRIRIIALLNDDQVVPHAVIDAFKVVDDLVRRLEATS